MGYSLPPEKNSHFNFLDLEKNIVNEIGDIKDHKNLKIKSMNLNQKLYSI